MANKSIIEQFSSSKDYISPIQLNLIKILEKEGPLTRKELVNELKTARTTIYDNLIKLQKQKMIEKFTRNDGKRGRPLVLWKLK